MVTALRSTFENHTRVVVVAWFKFSLAISAKHWKKPRVYLISPAFKVIVVRREIIVSACIDFEALSSSHAQRKAGARELAQPTGDLSDSKQQTENSHWLNLTTTFEHAHCGPCQHHRSVRALPSDTKLTTACVDQYRRIEITMKDAGHDGGTCARATRQRLTRAPLENPQTDVVAVNYLHKTSIDTPWKPRMVLNQWTELANRCGVDIIHPLHRVRVTH